MLAREGDTAIAVYTDEPLPPDYQDQTIVFTATTLVGSTGPPFERTPASYPGISDLDHNSITYPVVGQQILLTTDIVNDQNHSQDFVWIAQITDKDKKTQALSWINGTLNAQSSFSPTTSWIPTIIGDYRIVFFVWEIIGNPTALSPPIELDFKVLKENPMKHAAEKESTFDDLLTRQNLMEELRTVPRTGSVQNLTDAAQNFVVSEALQNNQISSILEGYTYNVECCSFSVDRQNPLLNQHVGLKFHIEEKYLFVTVTFDLKQEKVTAILKGSSDGFAIIPTEE